MISIPLFLFAFLKMCRASNENIPLISYPIIMSHDSASGEIIDDNIVMAWTKTQSGGIITN
jgi:hypothetical protein